ncbi:aldo/keto reductase, partial [Tetragenococcus halophilus]
MSILTEQYTLSNGVKIPKIGFGTWLVDDDKVVEPVKDAINAGYRHIDTAQAYE